MRDREDHIGLWLSPEAVRGVPDRRQPRAWWWLPPVIFPDEEPECRSLLEIICNRGGRTFVVNAPWRVALFGERRDLTLWAGPFCNLANPLALESAAALGLAGAIVSPELSGDEYLMLPRHSPIPLGIVIGGNWPKSPNEQTVFPNYRRVDYVRIYQRASMVTPSPTLDPNGPPTNTPLPTPTPARS